MDCKEYRETLVKSLVGTREKVTADREATDNPLLYARLNSQVLMLEQIIGFAAQDVTCRADAIRCAHCGGTCGNCTCGSDSDV